MMSQPEIKDVQNFWENNPLFTGESKHHPGSKDFFDEHSQIVIEDCLAGEFDLRTVPSSENSLNVLDLGCGPGFWLIELSKRGVKSITGADLTANAVQLSRMRCSIYGVKATVLQENAENLSFRDQTFTHVNCQGVIHHTPNTERCVAEIARVLKPGGTASISVYYKNYFIRNWSWLRYLGLILFKMGASLKGRGRESIFSLRSSNEIVRYYDGASNPIGKAYSESEFREMLSKHFEVTETYLHFFPLRTLPIKLPKNIHRFLDRNFGFMIYASCVRK